MREGGQREFSPSLRSNEDCDRSFGSSPRCETRSPRRHSHWSPLAPIAARGPPKSPILPELCRTHLGCLMQEPNLSQVSLCFFTVMPYGVQLSLECNLASTTQRGFKALNTKCSTSGKGISLLYFVAG